MRPQEMTHIFREIIVVSVGRIPVGFVFLSLFFSPRAKKKKSLRGTENLVKWFTQIHLAIFFFPILVGELAES